MSTQIGLTLQRIKFPSKFYNMKQVSIEILSDSGFQHLIQNRSIKNGTLNLFGEKTFMPSNTKQILFYIFTNGQDSIEEKICSLSYKIQDLSFNSRKISVTDCNENYNDFQLIFALKLSLEFETDSIHGTESQFEGLHCQKILKNLEITLDDQDFNSQQLKIQRLYSPVHATSKLLSTLSEQSWEIKSEYSPSKKRILIGNEQEKDWEGLQKKSTSESQTAQSQSVKKRPASSNYEYGRIHHISIPKMRRDEVNFEMQEVKVENKILHKLNTLIGYKNYLLFGGIFGIFSAVLSTQLQFL